MKYGHLSFEKSAGTKDIVILLTTLNIIWFEGKTINFDIIMTKKESLDTRMR